MAAAPESVMLVNVGPNPCSNAAQAGHNASSYSEMTALGSSVPSLVITLLDATRTDLVSPAVGLSSADIRM